MPRYHFSLCLSEGFPNSQNPGAEKDIQEANFITDFKA